MAKKFVYVVGLHNIFPLITLDNKLNTSSLLPGVASDADTNSTLYIVADDYDSHYGYIPGEKYIWTHGLLFDCNEEIISKISQVTDFDLNSVEIRQLKEKKTGLSFVPITHWDAISNKPNLDLDPYICSDTITDTPDGFVYRQTNNGIEKNKENATITRYVGNSLVWNQLIRNGNFENNTTTNWNVKRATASFTNGILNITCNDTELESGINQSLSGVVGHKYLITFKYKATKTLTIGLGGYRSTRSVESFTEYKEIRTASMSVINIELIYAGANGDSMEFDCNYGIKVIDLTLMFGAGNEPSTVEEFERMFPEPYYPYNAGTLINNRTQAIESVGFNQWDEETEEGRIDSTTGQNVSATGRWRCKNYISVFPNTNYYFGNQTSAATYVFAYDADKNYIGAYAGYNQWRTIPAIVNKIIIKTPSNCRYIRIQNYSGVTYNHDICINLSDTSRNGTYEPYKKYDLPINLNSFRVKDSNGNIITIEGGLKSAGSVYDEITSDGKYIKRVGSVDLGTLTYSYEYSDSYHIFHVRDMNTKVGAKKAVIYGINAICERYTSTFAIHGWGHIASYASNGADKEFCLCDSQMGSDSLVIRDTSYSDAATFKTAMDGVMLYYELATPEVYDLVEIIPNNYPVDDLGTEARIAPLIDGVPGSPFKGDIDYYRSSDSYLHTVTVNGFPAHVNNGTAEIELPLEDLSGHIYDKSKDSLAEGVIEGKGNINTASGVRSHAEGIGTVASGKASHTEGNGTTASAENAHAEGLNTQATKKAAHAEGNATVASATYAHAEGRETEATAESAHAEGYKTDATGKYSHTEGLESNANGKGSHTEGNKTHTDVNADFAHAEGNDTDANGKYSHAEGTETQSYGLASHAEGDRTYSSGDAAHAEGSRTYAYSKYGHAEGQQTQVFNDADAAHAEGYVTEARGKYSHAEGNNTYSIGDDSHAEGFHSNAVGVASHAEGYGSSVNPGPTFSWTTNSTTLTASQESSNLHVGDVLYYNNKARKITSINGTTIYIDNTFGGSATSATLEIMKCVAYGEASHAEGNRTYAVGDYSHAEGSNVKTVNEAEHGEGVYNRPIPGVSRHTVGIGTGESNRKNAHLITTDGKHYIIGIGGYDGTQTSLTGIQDVASVFGNYLPLAGGTMTGALTTPSLTVTGASSFSQAINGSILGNAATASRWQNARTLTLTGAVTGSVSIDGSNNVSLATTVNHNHDDRYLKLIGGTMTGAIKRDYDAVSDDPMISLKSNNIDAWLWRISHGSHTTASANGFGLKYIGTGSGVDNRLRLYTDNQGNTQLIAVSINQSGQLGIGTDSDTNYRVKVDGSSLLPTIYSGAIYHSTAGNRSNNYVWNTNGSYTDLGNYVTALGTSGDNLTWTKNGTTNNLTVPYATSSTNLKGGAKGSLPYQSAANTTAMLAIGTAGLVLKVNSSGLPEWGTDKEGVTSVTIKAGGGISIDSESAITSTGTRTITNTGVRSVTVNGNYLKVNTNGTDTNLTVPYASNAGNAATVTNGVYTVGDQTISGNKTFAGSTALDDATIGNLIVTGGASFALTINGNITSADKLSTARTISLTGDVTGSGTFDGSGNLSIATTKNHSHTFALITNHIVNGNEFNFVDVEQSIIWFNYKRASGSAATTATTNFKFGQGTGINAYAYLIANGFKKSGSSDLYVLLGGGGHKELADFATAGHDHDDRYVLKAGDTMTGALTVPSLSVTGASSFSQAINGSILGNAATASRLQNARTISLTGAVTGSGTFDGSGNLSIATTNNLGLGTAAYKNWTNSYLYDGEDLVTGKAIKAALDTLPTPMQFQGSVGTNGTKTWSTLPAAAASNEGHTYKVITAHDTAPICKVGDTIISNGSSWVVIPSGDEPSGTVTSVGLSVPDGSHLSVSNRPITSSGNLELSIDSGYSIPSDTKQSNWDTAYGWGNHAGKYLPIGGGTLTGKTTISTNSFGDQLVLNRGNNSGTWGPSIIFKNNDTFAASLGCDTSGVVYIGDNGSTKNKIWHAGNDGSGSGLDADYLDGKHASELLTTASLGTSGNDTTLSVTIGGTTKTGSVTVPYATSAGNADTVDSHHVKSDWNYPYTYSKSITCTTTNAIWYVKLTLRGYAEWNSFVAYTSYNNQNGPLFVKRCGFGQGLEIRGAHTNGNHITAVCYDSVYHSTEHKVVIYLKFDPIQTEHYSPSTQGVVSIYSDSDFDVTLLGTTTPTLSSGATWIQTVTTGKSYHGDLRVEGHIYPNSNQNTDLGTNSLYWNGAYLNTIYTNGISHKTSGNRSNTYVWNTNGGYTDLTGYSTTSHNHDDRYVNVTGDTMTGSLTVPSLSVTGASSFSLAINGSILGNAATASRLLNARTISLTGNVTGSGTFDGSGNLSITTTVNGGTATSVAWSNISDKPSTFAPSAHDHYRIRFTDNRNKYPGQIATTTTSLYGSFMSNTTIGITGHGSWSDAIIIRGYGDNSGGKENAIIFNKNENSVMHAQFDFGSTTSWGTTYIFLDSNNYNSYSPKLDGTGASGTWGISISGNAATATSAEKWTTARNISISDSDGTNTGTAVSVDGSANATLKLPSTIKATASNVTVNDSNSNSSYKMVWHSGNTLYSTADITCNPSTDEISAKAVRAKNNDLYVGSASGSQCHQVYDSTNKVLRFLFD